jgi:hypothetical protein
MEIKLSKDECEEFFLNALCNAVSTGYMDGYGIEFVYDRSQYKASREHLVQSLEKTEMSNTAVCTEDIWMQILRDGGSLTFEDIEGEGDMTRTITMEDVYARMPLVPNRTLMEMANGEDDASTADIILQTIFFEGVIFG